MNRRREVELNPESGKLNKEKTPEIKHKEDFSRVRKPAVQDKERCMIS
jgi:hypothetical protein